MEKAHPLLFPMGIGGLHDAARARAEEVTPKIWAQHLLRQAGGWFVHGLQGHRVVWAIVNTVLLAETRGKGYVVQTRTMRRMGHRLASEEPLTREALRAMIQSEETAGRLVHTLMTVGQSVRSTPMQWAAESSKLDTGVKFLSWRPPWVRPPAPPDTALRECSSDGDVGEDIVGE